MGGDQPTKTASSAPRDETFAVTARAASIRNNSPLSALGHYIYATLSVRERSLLLFQVSRVNVVQSPVNVRTFNLNLFMLHVGRRRLFFLSQYGQQMSQIDPPTTRMIHFFRPLLRPRSQRLSVTRRKNWIKAARAQDAPKRQENGNRSKDPLNEPASLGLRL